MGDALRGGGATWLAAALIAASCTAGTETIISGDGAADGSRTDVAGEASPDADAAGATDGSTDDAGPLSGPVTSVVRETRLSDERMCDFDGDGLGDNAIAELGNPASGILLSALNATIEGEVEAHNRICLHFPWVDDLRQMTDASTTLIVFRAAPTDDPEQDLSGEQSFFAQANCLDACGEPLYYTCGHASDHGRMEGSLDAMPIPFGDVDDSDSPPIQGRQVRIEATATSPGSGSARLCYYVLCSDLGAKGGVHMAGDLTMLEVLLAGGGAFGIAGIPGFSPDVDVDGDGLERFVLDEGGRIASCVDGDSTTIAGRDCWADERMADAISFVSELDLVRAYFGGREEGWEDEVDGTCDDPPETSLFDPH